jgi:hypothetical protein
MQTRSVSNIKVALVWTVLGAFETAAVLPYVFALFPIASAKVPVPLAVVAAAQLVQATVLYLPSLLARPYLWGGYWIRLASGSLVVRLTHPDHDAATGGARRLSRMRGCSHYLCSVMGV